MCINNVLTYSFLYLDCEYFRWFQNQTFVNFQSIIRWKGLHRHGSLHANNQVNFWNNNNINLAGADDLPLVSRVFLHHLTNPEEYPLIDRNVWTAMRLIQANQDLPENFGDYNFDHYVRYQEFFNARYAGYQQAIPFLPIEDVDNEITKRRVLDRALFEYGRMNQ